MRSRDGNRTFSRAICTIILFNSLVLSASEYLISYRYVVKNATLSNESLLISKAMQSCQGTPQNALILQNDDDNDLQAIISENSEEFIEYLHKLGLNVEHAELTNQNLNNSSTILTLKTTCFKVDFNDNFAKIAPLK